MNSQTLDDNDLFIRSDIEFHRELAEIPDNPIFMAVHVALLDWLIAARPTVAQDVLHAHNNVSYQQHIEIYNAIQARDPDAADAALKAHLKSVFASYYPAPRKRSAKK